MVVDIECLQGGGGGGGEKEGKKGEKRKSIGVLWWPCMRIHRWRRSGQRKGKGGRKKTEGGKGSLSL